MLDRLTTAGPQHERGGAGHDDPSDRTVLPGAWGLSRPAQPPGRTPSPHRFPSDPAQGVIEHRTLPRHLRSDSEMQDVHTCRHKVDPLLERASLKPEMYQTKPDIREICSELADKRRRSVQNRLFLCQQSGLHKKEGENVLMCSTPSRPQERAVKKLKMKDLTKGKGRDNPVAPKAQATLIIS